jgi:hypothetical protein
MYDTQRRNYRNAQQIKQLNQPGSSSLNPLFLS